MYLYLSPSNLGTYLMCKHGNGKVEVIMYMPRATEDEYFDAVRGSRS